MKLKFNQKLVYIKCRLPTPRRYCHHFAEGTSYCGLSKVKMS